MSEDGINQLIGDAYQNGTIQLILRYGKPSTAVFIAEKAGLKRRPRP